MGISDSVAGKISSISLRRQNGAYVNDNWSRAHLEIMKAAAQDKAVARIFVFPGAKVAVYDYEQQFIPALSIFDMQLEHATRCLLPSPSIPGEEGWYFNFGAAQGTVEEVFTVSSIIASGR